MAIVRQGDWIEIKTTRLNSKKINLKGQIFQVLRTNPNAGALTIDTGEMMGQLELLNTDVKEAYVPKVPAPKKPSITPAQIIANIQTLIGRYQAIGGKVDVEFLEQILGRELSEQILSKPDISRKNGFCSEETQGSNSWRLFNK